MTETGPKCSSDFKKMTKTHEVVLQVNKSCDAALELLESQVKHE